MAENIYIPPQNIRAPDAVAKTRGERNSGSQKTGPAFGAVLEQHLRGSEVTFSKHATARMQSRGIELSPASMGRLNQAVSQAQAKGCRDSLVLLDNNAMVVSVKDNTVVTVADKEQLKGNIFTNIDSAIIA
ncbi:MAG: TIGR02530 family flagellar biosynthesis protein [Desulfuromonadaceae bacterium]